MAKLCHVQHWVNTTLVTKNHLSLEFSLFADLFILTLYLILGNSNVPFDFETWGYPRTLGTSWVSIEIFSDHIFGIPNRGCLGDKLV